MESVQELLQGFDDTIRVHSGAPGTVVSADHPLIVEKGEDSLFHAASDDLGLNGA